VKKIGADLCMEVMEADYEEPLLRKTENQVKAVFEGEERVDFSSKLERYDGMAKIESQIKLLGNSLGVILALLALMNYINMTAAGIQNRSREFAALESLGMTRTQIKRNLIKEGLGYGGISILLSLALGIPLGFLVFQAMNIYGVSFSLPIGKNLVLYLLLLLAAGSIPPLLYRRTQKGSLVERMRRIS
jgi:putative ABC transport system permease protein